MIGKVGDILICEAVVIICCVSNIGNQRGNREEEKELLHQLQLSFSNHMDPNEYFSRHNLNSTGRKQTFLYATKYAIRMGVFYFHSYSLHKGYVQKMVSDLLHTGSSLAQSNYVSREIRGLAAKHYKQPQNLPYATHKHTVMHESKLS